MESSDFKIGKVAKRIASIRIFMSNSKPNFRFAQDRFLKGRLTAHIMLKKNFNMHLRKTKLVARHSKHTVFHAAANAVYLEIDSVDFRSSDVGAIDGYTPHGGSARKLMS